MRYRTPVAMLVAMGSLSAVACLIALAGHASAGAEGFRKTAPQPTTGRKSTLTFTHDIAPILMANCVSCHRPGQIGPFSLLGYEDVKKRARQIAQVTESHFMPPWHADSHGEFLNERKLTPEQIGLVHQWVEAGTPKGETSDMPSAPHFESEWALGQPDLVLEPSATYTLGADGQDVYRYFVLPTGLSADTYVSAMEVRPGNARVVHHVIAYLDNSGQARQSDTAGNGFSPHDGKGFSPTGALGGWAPGNIPHRMPEGTGTLLPKGADVVLEIHYHKSGKIETDRTRIGLYLCHGPVDKRLRILPVFAPLKIPAGDANYTVHSFPMPVMGDISVLDVMPHMHLLGKEMTITAKLPDGEAKPLIHVPNYDFNWQTTYTYKEPVKLPGGSSVSLVARYDNSTANPRNPNNPPRQVGWGEETTDEMCIGFVWFTYDKEHLTQGQPVVDMIDNFLAGRQRKSRSAGGE